MTAIATTASEAGTLAQRIVAAPTLCAPADAERRLDDWLAEITPGDAATLRRQFNRNPHARALVLGLADGSPHLWDLVTADPARLARLLESDPELRFGAILADAAAAIAATDVEAEV